MSIRFQYHTRQAARRTLSHLAYGAIRLRGRVPPGVRILTYHRVNDWHPDDCLSVPVARFTEQMRWLHEQGYRTLTLTEALVWLKEATGRDRGQETGSAGSADDSHPSPRAPRPAPQRIVLTFDDGYADNYWHVSPVLQKHGFCATLFVASGLMDRDVPMPRYAGGSLERDRGLTWEEIRAMQAHGVEIGAHTISHPDLTAITPDAARREIVESKRQIERETGRPVQAFAYPKGRLNAQVAALVREAGYASACSERIGANRVGEDVFRLRRTEVSAHDTLDDFEKKLAGAYDWLHRAVQRAGRVEGGTWKVEQTTPCAGL